MYTKDQRQHLWSIGIVTGKNLLSLSTEKDFPNPRFRAVDVNGFKAKFVADPFLLADGDNWLLFFEVMNSDSGLGELGVARSKDAMNWEFDSVVLKEPFHLSYPFVFKDGDNYYMIPETKSANEVRLYKSVNFPTKWELDKVLFSGNYTDSSIIKFNNKWWIFSNNGAYTLDLWFSDDLHGTWKKHPMSPIYTDDITRSRPGGRPIILDGKIMRFVQDNRGGYGKRVRAFVVDTIDEEHFSEHPVEKDPLWEPNGNTWAFNGIHQFSPVLRKDGTWIAAIDGNGVPEVDRGLDGNIEKR